MKSSPKEDEEGALLSSAVAPGGLLLLCEHVGSVNGFASCCLFLRGAFWSNLPHSALLFGSEEKWDSEAFSVLVLQGEGALIAHE